MKRRRLGFLTGGQNYEYIVLFKFQNHLSPIKTERDRQTHTGQVVFFPTQRDRHTDRPTDRQESRRKCIEKEIFPHGSDCFFFFQCPGQANLFDVYRQSSFSLQLQSIFSLSHYSLFFSLAMYLLMFTLM